jgi:hypothetical protein
MFIHWRWNFNRKNPNFTPVCRKAGIGRYHSLCTERSRSIETNHIFNVGNNMKNQISFIFLVLGFWTLQAQHFVVDSTLFVEKTEIKTFTYERFNKKSIELTGPVFDSITDKTFSQDTLRVTFSKRGLGGQTLVLSISDTVNPEIILRSDYPAFEGKYSKSLELELSEIIINKTDFISGDTIIVRLRCLSKPYSRYIGNPKFEYSGTIKHVLELK